MADRVGEVDRGSRVALLIVGTAVLLVVGAMIAIPVGFIVELSAATCV